MLSNFHIKTYLSTGAIVIEPFHETQLGTNSYDVRLGNWYYLPNPDVQSVDFTQEYESKNFWLGPRYSNSRIMVPAGETILAHTLEIIGARDGITTAMKARSSIGRSCLSVCKCAGVGDVGFVNRWTMEITNHSKADIYLPVGLRVAQIEFHKVGQILKGTEYSGKYLSHNGPLQWQPQDMLPRLYLDQDYQEYAMPEIPTIR
jgi:dCTP deaminase